jgi:hypothetical protein
MRRGRGGANDRFPRVTPGGTSMASPWFMLDAIFMVASVVFFAISCAYVVACDRM